MKNEYECEVKGVKYLAQPMADPSVVAPAAQLTSLSWALIYALLFPIALLGRGWTRPLSFGSRRSSQSIHSLNSAEPFVSWWRPRSPLLGLATLARHRR